LLGSGSINQISTKNPYSSVVHPPRASFLRDPITVPRQERVDHYRGQAARYKRMAEVESPSVREGLLALAQQCDDMADALLSDAGRSSD